MRLRHRKTGAVARRRRTDEVSEFRESMIFYYMRQCRQARDTTPGAPQATHRSHPPQSPCPLKRRRTTRKIRSTSRSRIRCVVASRLDASDRPPRRESLLKLHPASSDACVRLDPQDNSEVHFKVKLTTKFEKVRARRVPDRDRVLCPSTPRPSETTAEHVADRRLRARASFPPDLQRLLLAQGAAARRRALPVRRLANQPQPDP